MLIDYKPRACALGYARSAALAGLILPFVLCIPRVSYWASPSFHPGLCRSSALAGLILPFVLCVPRVSYWASPSFCPGLCRSVALAGLFQFLIPGPNPFPCTNISEPTNARRPQSNPTITLPTTDQAQIRLSLYIIWVWVSPLGRHSCIAQGGESAKGTNRTLGTHDSKNKSSVGAALTARAFGLCRCGSWLCIR